VIAEPLRFEMRLIAVIPRRCNYAWHCNGRDRLTPPHCNCEKKLDIGRLLFCDD